MMFVAFLFFVTFAVRYFGDNFPPSISTVGHGDDEAPLEQNETNNKKLFEVKIETLILAPYNYFRCTAHMSSP